jgi:hypothetical protein
MQRQHLYVAVAGPIDRCLPQGRWLMIVLGLTDICWGGKGPRGAPRGHCVRRLYDLSARLTRLRREKTMKYRA